MQIEYRVVEGAAVAAEASLLLQRAWGAPALHYCTAYVAWQLGFPGPCPAPAVAAFAGLTMVGFAGSLHRRLQTNGIPRDVLLVSLVAVDPDYRQRGIGAALYQVLLDAIRPTGLPIVTFGRAESAGLRAIERSYPVNGWPLQAFGSYTPFATVVRSKDGADAWVAASQLPTTPLADAVARSAPTDPQLEHYFRDPRPRRLMVHRDGICWAWITETEYVSPRGVESATTLDSVSVSSLSQLPGLAAAAAEKTTLIQAPSLFGSDPGELRQHGFRQTATPWIGFWAGGIAPSEGTNLEIA